LPRLIGFGRAKELIFTGRLLEAPEAERIGLLNRVVPEGQALSAALEMAATIAAQGATAIRLAKLALNAQRHDVDVSHTLESVAQALLFEGAEKRERMTAFLERKRR
jgi:enoyl-CoA hydratase